MMGGNVRVGLEDSLYIGPGKLASSNAEQVTKIRRIVEDLGHEIATPTEARQMLGLKGGDRVKFLASDGIGPAKIANAPARRDR